MRCNSNAYSSFLNPSSTNSNQKYNSLNRPKSISVKPTTNKENIPYFNTTLRERPPNKTEGILKFNPKVVRSSSHIEIQHLRQFKARPLPNFDFPFVIYNSTNLTKFKEFKLITSKTQRINKRMVYEKQITQRKIDNARKISTEDKIKCIIKGKSKPNGVFSNLLQRIL